MNIVIQEQPIETRKLKDIDVGSIVRFKGYQTKYIVIKDIEANTKKLITLPFFDLCLYEDNDDLEIFPKATLTIPSI